MDTKKLRQKILDLAIHGKLVPQDPNDEPASVLLERIKAEKELLIKEGKIKPTKKTAKTSDTPHYKNVPFEVPEGWVWCKLDDLAFYKKGPFGSSLTKSMFVSPGENTYKVYEQKNAIQKDNTLGTYFITKEKYDSLIGFSVQPYDIIVSCAGTIGETYVLPQDSPKGIINQALMLIRLYNHEIERFYLLYFDYILKEKSYKESKGTAIKNIPPFDVLKNFYIPIPPINEQNRILDEVDKWMLFISSLRDNQISLKAIVKQTKTKILDLAIHGKLVPQDPNDEPASELLKRINPNAQITTDNGHSKKLPKGWSTTQLRNLTEIKNGYAFKSSKYVSSNGVRIIRIANVQDGYIEDKMPQFYPFEEMETLQDFMLEEGIMLMSLTGNVGRVGLLTRDFLPAALNQRVAYIKESSKVVEKKYLFYLFQTNDFLKDCLKSGRGIAQINISTEWLKHYLILLPPLAEQQRIVHKIEELFSVLDNIQKALEA